MASVCGYLSHERADDRILLQLVSTIADDLGCWNTRALLGSGPQLANMLLGEGSPDALDVGRHIPSREFQHPEPGNVDLPRTMPLPDFAANAGTPVPKTSVADHEGRSLRANNSQI